MTNAQGISAVTSNYLPSTFAPGSRIQGNYPQSASNTAKEFEAMVMSMLLKEMRQASGSESLFPGDQGDVQGGMFDLFMGQYLAEANGIGIKDIVERQLREYPPNGTRSEAGSTRGNVPESSGS